jgi:uncharacterized protein with PhoU and TrkA domain
MKKLDNETSIDIIYRSVYDSTRLANEITGLESKLNSLVNIRQTLIRDNNKPQAGIQSMGIY